MNKHTLVILRVSTEQQKVDAQWHALQAEIANRGLLVVTLDDFIDDPKKWAEVENLCVKVEDTYTGKTADRKGYSWALSQIKGGWVKAVLAWDVSRLNRNSRNALALADACMARKVELFTVKDHVDITTPEGKLQYIILSAFAEYEREKIVERTKAGIAARRAKGLPHGGTSKGWTSKRVNKKLDTLFKMLDAGMSTREIHRSLGLNPRTVRKYRGLRGQTLISRKDLNKKVYGRSDARDI